jgi:hypothetical protein
VRGDMAMRFCRVSGPNWVFENKSDIVALGAEG